jgi:hypothetical protein
LGFVKLIALQFLGRQLHRLPAERALPRCADKNSKGTHLEQRTDESKGFLGCLRTGDPKQLRCLPLHDIPAPQEKAGDDIGYSMPL